MPSIESDCKEDAILLGVNATTFGHYQSSPLQSGAGYYGHLVTATFVQPM